MAPVLGTQLLCLLLLAVGGALGHINLSGDSEHGVWETGMVDATLPYELAATNTLQAILRLLRYMGTRENGVQTIHPKPYRLPPLRQSDPAKLVAVHTIRPGVDLTWEGNYNSVTGAGHPWCPLIRDNWACEGETYENVLKSTPHFNSSLTLENLPKGSRLLVYGQSHTGNQFLPVVCYGQALGSGWYIDSVANANSYLYYTPSVSPIDLENGLDGIIAVVLSNHDLFQAMNASRFVLHSLSLEGFNPTHILYGDVNSGADIAQVVSMLRGTWPGAQMLKMPFKSTVCKADFTNCQDGLVGRHSCFPGPAMLMTEKIMRNLIYQEE